MILPSIVASSVDAEPLSPLLTPVSLLPDCDIDQVPLPVDSTPFTVALSVPIQLPATFTSSPPPPHAIKNISVQAIKKPCNSLNYKAALYVAGLLKTDNWSV